MKAADRGEDGAHRRAGDRKLSQLEGDGAGVPDGFTAPASSQAAKQEWRLEADQVAQFVDDVCTRDAKAKATSSEVFSAYRD